MIIQLMLFIGLTPMFRGTDGKPTEELGKAINLRETNLLGDFIESEASVFLPLPEECFKREKLYYTGSNYDYYASTKAFYSKVAVGAGLDASLESSYTLGATLSSLVQNSDSKESEVSGITLNVRALTEKILVNKDCLDNDGMSTLTTAFFEDLQRLPRTISKPWYANSWESYKIFLETYGSHIITSVEVGSSIRQNTFAESDSSYSERELQVKSCVSLSGPTSAGNVGVEACANVSKSEISKATNMNTVDTLVLRGGTKETRNALRTKRTDELIEKFLNEAGESDSSVEHTFRSLWEILQSRFKIGSENFIRAVNLQYYYLGFLNYGCRDTQSGGVHVQKFDYSSKSSELSPDFECTLASEGCHSTDDCHYHIGIWCNCQGNSCIRYKDEKQDTGTIKTTAYANTGEAMAWHGCDWKVAGSRCDCYNKNINSRKLVWRIPSRDVVHKDGIHGGHYKFETPDQSGEEEE